MDIEKINRLREARRKRNLETSNSSFPISNDKPHVESNSGRLNLDECLKEFNTIEERIKTLLQTNGFEEASQRLNYFYNAHKLQVGQLENEFYKTFGFKLDYWELYIMLSRYEERIINYEHITNPQSIINAERDIERNLEAIMRWEELNKDEYSSRDVEYLNSRFQNSKKSKEEYTAEAAAENSCKQLGQDISKQLENRNFDEASKILDNFYKDAKKTYAKHKKSLKNIKFHYLYWNAYLNIKILESYAEPENYGKEKVKELKKRIENNIDEIRSDEAFNKAYGSRIDSLDNKFDRAKARVKKNNQGEKHPWMSGCGTAVVVFILVMICKSIWNWGDWTLWVWPLVCFFIGYVGESSDD